MLQVFKKHNVDLSAKTSQGQNPLQYAASMNLTTIMNYLIKRMPNLDQEDDSGFTIFSRYLLMENFDICQKLIESGWKINHININGKTPLHLVVECRKIEAIEFLLERGADPHIENFYGEDICEKIQKYNLKLKDLAMVPILQWRPDRRVKIDPDKIKESKKEEEEDHDEEGSDSSVEDDDLFDQESMAYENQTSSSETETENSEMLMTGSSFWVSEIGNSSPSARKSMMDEVENSENFIQRLREEERSEKKIENMVPNSPSFKSERKKEKYDKQEKLTIKTKPTDYSIKIKLFGSPVIKNQIHSRTKSGLNKDLLVPQKSDSVESKTSLTSMVSNPFRINIIEQNDESDFLSKIRKSSDKIQITSKNNSDIESPQKLKQIDDCEGVEEIKEVEEIKKVEEVEANEDEKPIEKVRKEKMVIEKKMIIEKKDDIIAKNKQIRIEKKEEAINENKGKL